MQVTAPELKPGQALVLHRQLLAFQGARDFVVLSVIGRTAHGRAVKSRSQIPIRAAMSKTIFRFPLRGVWWVGVGATPHTGHRWIINEEFALDIGKLGGNGLDHSGAGDAFRTYYAYGAGVLAAAAGKVIAAVDGIAEHSEAMRRTDESMDDYAERLRQQQADIGEVDPKRLLGNYVVLQHGHGEYSLYAHLQPASLRVKLGDTVQEGQVIGRLGSSGNSTGPHLHFQVCDGPDPLYCAGIPISFKGIDLPWGDYSRPIQSGDLVVAR